MPTSEDIKYYRSCFDEYIKQFSDNGHYPENIQIKIDHSLRVYYAIIEIAESLALSGHDLFLAKLTGLFHDIGRFKQYAVYKTFSDSKSEDHAKLGLDVIKENSLFDTLSKEDQELISNTIYYHNKRYIPKASKREAMFFKLLRDADKLDIYKVVTENLLVNNNNKTLTLDLPDQLSLSPENYSDIMAHKIVDKNNLHTRYDFLFLVVSWVYDINYKKTMELIIKHEYLNKLFDLVADIKETKIIKPMILKYTEQSLHQFNLHYST